MANCVWVPVAGVVRRVVRHAVPRRRVVTGLAGGAAARVAAPRVVRWTLVCLAGAMPALPLSGNPVSPGMEPAAIPVADGGALPLPVIPEGGDILSGSMLGGLDMERLLSGLPGPAGPPLLAGDPSTPGFVVPPPGPPAPHGQPPGPSGDDTQRERPPVVVSEPGSLALLASFTMMAWPLWRLGRRTARPESG